MRAHVDQRVDLRRVLQPEPERDQRVARRQRGIVIVGAPLAGASAVGRQRDQNVAEGARAETKCAVAHIRIVGGAPQAASMRSATLGGSAASMRA